MLLLQCYYAAHPELDAPSHQILENSLTQLSLQRAVQACFQ